MSDEEGVQGMVPGPSDVASLDLNESDQEGSYMKEKPHWFLPQLSTLFIQKLSIFVPSWANWSKPKKLRIIETVAMASP
jgi:hypothetical protein